MYRISKNQLAKKNDFMRKNGILKIHQDDRACRNFLLDICPELCDMYILYYYYEIHDEKQTKQKLTMNFTIKKHNQVGILCYILHRMIFPSFLSLLL